MKFGLPPARVRSHPAAGAGVHGGGGLQLQGAEAGAGDAAAAPSRARHRQAHRLVRMLVRAGVVQVVVVGPAADVQQRRRQRGVVQLLRSALAVHLCTQLPETQSNALLTCS